MMKTTLGFLATTLVLLTLSVGCTQPAAPGTSTATLTTKAALGPRDARLVFHFNSTSRAVHSLGEIGFLTVQLLSPQNEMVRFGKAAKAATQPDPFGVDFVVDFPQLEAGTWNTRVLLYDKEVGGTLLFYALQPILIQVGQATPVPTLAVYEPGSVGGVTFVEALPPASVVVRDQYFRAASGSPLEWPLNTGLQLSARVDSATVDGGTGLALPAREQGVQWSSSRPQVAWVDENGLAQTTGNLGTAVLTATSTFDPSISAQFSVNVVPTIVGTWSAVGPGGRALVWVTPVPGTTGYYLTLFSRDPKTYGGTLSGPLRVTPSESGWFPDDFYPGATLTSPRVVSYFDGFFEAVGLPDPMTMILAKEEGIRPPSLPPPFDRMATTDWTLNRVVDFTPVTTLTPVAVTANLVSGSSFQFAVTTDGLATFSDGSLLSWSTDDSSILSVSLDGLVRGRTPGTANVIVRSLDPQGASLSFGVTVAAGPADPVIEPVDPTLVLHSPALINGVGRFHSIVADANGPGWILAGSSGDWSVDNSNFGLLLARLDATGKIDTNYGTNSGITVIPGPWGWVMAQDPQAPHDVVVQTLGGGSSLWRFRADGRVKLGFGDGGSGSVALGGHSTETGFKAPFFGPDGSIYALTDSDAPPSYFDKISPQGAVLAAPYWTSPTNDWALGGTVGRDGKLLYVGYGGDVLRVDGGSTDRTFGFMHGTNDYRTNLNPFTDPAFLFAVRTDAQNRVYVLGNAKDQGNDWDLTFIARLNPDGSLDTTYGTPYQTFSNPGYFILPHELGRPADFALEDDGTVVVVGDSALPELGPYWLMVVAPDGARLVRQVQLNSPGFNNASVTGVAVDAAGNFGVSGYVVNSYRSGTTNTDDQPAFWMVAK